jgi:hypothetical protein
MVLSTQKPALSANKVRLFDQKVPSNWMRY